MPPRMQGYFLVEDSRMFTMSNFRMGRKERHISSGIACFSG